MYEGRIVSVAHTVRWIEFKSVVVAVAFLALIYHVFGFVLVVAMMSEVYVIYVSVIAIMYQVCHL